VTTSTTTTPVSGYFTTDFKVSHTLIIFFFIILELCTDILTNGDEVIFSKLFYPLKILSDKQKKPNILVNIRLLAKMYKINIKKIKTVAITTLKTYNRIYSKNFGGEVIKGQYSIIIPFGNLHI